MNARPHTHALKVRRQWWDNTGCYVVEYGDTKVYVRRGPLLARRLRRAARVAVRRHDAGSLAAAARVAELDRLSGELPTLPPDRWGSEVLS